ncbi:RNA-directed DNA polymerase, eukaryota, reverse transcriptase zinc-binding domain protein [Tanacetum coccineum]
MLGWNPRLLKVMLIDITKQAILCTVELIPNKIRFYCTIVYANYNGMERRSLWKELDVHKQLIKKAPWVIMGDFNVTLNATEHSSGSSGRTIDMVEFSDTINSLEVEDICSNIILINDEFLHNYHAAHGVFLPYTVSDHSPDVLHIKNGFPKKKNSFRFSNFVADKEEFINLVKEVWNVDIHGCHMYKLVKKLKMLKKPLKNLSWKQGNVFENVVALKARLKSIQAGMDKNPHDAILKNEAVCILNEYVEAAKDEMKMFHQKAKVKWLKEGDKNTAFFHCIIKSRRSKNRVEYIKDDDGVSYNGEAVPEQFVKHFENFLGKTDQVISVDDSLFTKTLSIEEAKNMIDIVTDKEIKEALFDIESNKASGTDGYTFDFSKKPGMLLEKSAFIPGMHIQDNILIAQELLRGHNRKNSPKRCEIQIDVQKAYDTVSWSFLEEIHGKFGFHKKMVSWIMIYVRSTSFSICLNRESHRFFKGGRGLRQGDPISPYLFTLVMEVFSLIMEKNIEESNEFGYHFRCKELKLSHICFVDDLLVLCKGNKGSIKVVKKSLE